MRLNSLFFAILFLFGNNCLAQSGWFYQNSGISSYLQDVSFSDANNGTAVGPFGMILRTTNGGNTWTQQSSGSSSLILQSVSFTDANTGTIVGAGGAILRTTNGGSTWTAQTSGTSAYLWDVSFTDSNNGTVVGNNGTILRTTNGGAAWVPQQSGTTHALVGVSFADANTGTVVGDNGTILRTTNGGLTWIMQASGTTNNLFRTSFTDPNHGTVIGMAGTILSTTDGGTTWTQQVSGTTERLLDVDFTDANNGTVVGDFGTILNTADGGTTWIPQASGTTRDLHGVSFSSTNTGTAVGGQGTILRIQGPTACNPPTNPAISLVSSSDITATWIAPAGVSSFEYLVNQTGTAPQSAGIPITGGSTSVSSLNPGTSYYFHLRSVCSAGTFSSWVSVPFTTSQICQAPGAVTISSITDTKGTASWSAAAGADYYLYAVNQSSAAPTTGGTSFSGSSITIDSLSPGTNYFFHIQAYCGGGDYSSWVSVPFTTSSVNSLPDEVENTVKTTFYPNPAYDRITFRKTDSESGNLILLSALGNELKEVHIKEEFTEIDLLGFASGIYFLRFTNGSVNEVFKLQKQ